MKSIEPFTVEYEYFPLTGALLWRYCPNAHKGWNTKYAGKPATAFPSIKGGKLGVGCGLGDARDKLPRWEVLYQDPNLLLLYPAALSFCARLFRCDCLVYHDKP
jgi:hypothetical protein